MYVCKRVCGWQIYMTVPAHICTARGSSLVMHGHALPFMVNFYFSKNVQLYDTVNRVLSQEPSPAEHIRTQQCIHPCTTMRTRRRGAIRSQTGQRCIKLVCCTPRILYLLFRQKSCCYYCCAGVFDNVGIHPDISQCPEHDRPDIAVTPPAGSDGTSYAVAR